MAGLLYSLQAADSDSGPGSFSVPVWPAAELREEGTSMACSPTGEAGRFSQTGFMW
jgi:hypothetical protein